jgi:hypothetical protein
MHPGVEVLRFGRRAGEHAEHPVAALGDDQLAVARIEVPGADIGRVDGQGHGLFLQGQAGGGGLALGDVGGHADEAHALAVPEEGAAEGLDPAQRAVVAAMDAVFAVDGGVAGRIHGDPHGLHQGGQVVGVDQALEGVGRIVDRALGQAVDLAAALVPETLAGRGVVVPAAQAGGVDGDPKIGLGGFQGRLDALALGDVDHHAAMANRPAQVVAIDLAPRLHPAGRAVRMDQPILLEEIARGLQVGAIGHRHPLTVVGMQRAGKVRRGDAPGGAFGIDIVERGEAGVGIDLVGEDVPVPGAHAAGRLQGQLIALFADSQGLFGPHPSGGFRQHDQHPAHAAARGGIGQGREAEREVAVGDGPVGMDGRQRQVLDDVAAARPVQYRALGRLGLGRRGRRGLGEGLAQHLGVALAQHRRIGVVVDQNQVAAPAQGGWEPAGDDHVDREPQAGRPAFARAQRRGGPVERRDPRAHAVARQRIDDPSLITGIDHPAPFPTA